MPRRGENIHKRKDERWEGRYIKKQDTSGKAIYGWRKADMSTIYFANFWSDYIEIAGNTSDQVLAQEL